jgi:acid phosphatase
VNGISPEAPAECTVDQAVYIARHGSRYPDPGAYNGWVELYEQVRREVPMIATTLTASSCLRQSSRHLGL